MQIDSEVLVSIFVGVLAPFLIQFLRLLSEKTGLVIEGAVAQVITLVVSAGLAYVIHGQLGSISVGSSPLEAWAIVYPTAQVAYELFKSYLGGWLPSKQ